MKKGDVDRFFRELGRRVKVPVRVYLTGGALAWFWGGFRPTEDLDFGLKAPPGRWREVEEAIGAVSRLLAIPVQFSEDIGRWGMIGLRSYERGAKFYRQFGRVRVYFLDIPVWAVGKIQRYYQSDVDDLKKVLKSQKTSPESLIKVLSRAFRQSPKSSAQILFIRTVEDFLRNYGKEIWGRGFDPSRHFASFKKRAGIKQRRAAGSPFPPTDSSVRQPTPSQTRPGRGGG